MCPLYFRTANIINVMLAAVRRHWGVLVPDVNPYASSGLIRALRGPLPAGLQSAQLCQLQLLQICMLQQVDTTEALKKQHKKYRHTMKIK